MKSQNTTLGILLFATALVTAFVLFNGRKEIVYDDYEWSMW